MSNASDPGINFEWRGAFTSTEANQLHAEAFDTEVFSDQEWPWAEQVDRHSLGWVTARSGTGELVGFVNVISDGFIHAWIQDVMVSESAQRQRVGVQLVHLARDQCRDAGCEWLHVDFDDEHASFYIEACGFTPASAGLMPL